MSTRKLICYLFECCKKRKKESKEEHGTDNTNMQTSEGKKEYMLHIKNSRGRKSWVKNVWEHVSL